MRDETSSEQFLEEKSHTLRIIMKLVFFLRILKRETDPLYTGIVYIPAPRPE